MLSSSISYDILCYPLKNHFYDRLENQLQVNLDKLFSEIEIGLKGNEDLNKFSLNKMNSIFDLRMQAMSWLFENAELEDLSETLEEAYDDFDVLLKYDSNYLFLVENLKFSLRANKQYVDSFIEEMDRNPEMAEEAFKPEVFKITMQQFTSSIALAIPDEDLAQRILDLVGASLKIEFSLICAWLLMDKKMVLPANKIKDLTSLVGNSAQDFSAICYELGIGVKSKSEQRNFQHKSEYIIEQQNLADLGLNDLIEL